MESNLNAECGIADSTCNRAVVSKTPAIDESTSTTPPAGSRSTGSGSGSLSLMECLDRERKGKAVTLPRTNPEGLRSHSTSDVHVPASPGRPLTKALQPKENRGGSQTPIAFQTTSRKFVPISGNSPQPTGVTPTASVSPYQRHNSASASSTSSTGQLPVRVGAEVHSYRPETVNRNLVGRRGVIQEPNPGLMMLRSMQRQQADVGRIQQHIAIPEVETSDKRPKSTSVLDSVSVLQPSKSTDFKSKSATSTPPTTYDHTEFSITSDDPSDTVPAEPKSKSNAVFQPSMSSNFSEPSENRRTITVLSGQARIETDKEPKSVSSKPVIQVRKPSTGETVDNEKTVSETGSSLSDNPAVTSQDGGQPTESHDIQVVDENVGDSTTKSETAQDRPEPATTDDVEAIVLPETNIDEKTNDETEDFGRRLETSRSGSNTVPGESNSDSEDKPPPLPTLPPPRFHLPLSLNDEYANDDDDSTTSVTFMGDRVTLTQGRVAPHFHRPTDSNVTVDSGFECLSPQDDLSADEQEAQQSSDIPAILTSQSTALSSVGSRSLTPTSINTDSELDDTKLDAISPHQADGTERIPLVTPASDHSAVPGTSCATGSSITTPAGTRLLDRLLFENGTSLDHFRCQVSTAPTNPLPSRDPPDIPLPVGGPEVAGNDQVGDGFPSESAAPSTPSGSVSSRDRKTDDVIRYCAAERSVDGSHEVEITKGSLGLGFCIQGGKGSAAGDRPIVVKRLFRGDSGLTGDLRVGDEIVSVNGQDFTQLSHYQAWNTLKRMPDGTLHLIVKRP